MVETVEEDTQVAMTAESVPAVDSSEEGVGAVQTAPDGEQPVSASAVEYGADEPDVQASDTDGAAAADALEESTATPGIQSATGADAWFGSDHNGDGRTEVVVLYDLGGHTTALYVFEPTDSGFAAPNLVWTSAPGAWEWQQSKMMVTDYNGDGYTEVTVLYDLGNHTSALYVFDPTLGGYAAPRQVWVSALGTWEWQQSYPTVTDYDGDDKTEVTVLYDLGNATTGLYVFDPSASGFAAPRQVWQSAPGGWLWHASKPVATDRNGDGSTEITALYNLGEGVLGLYVFEPAAGGFAAPGRVWMSGPGGLYLRHCKPVVVDNDADGNTELAIFYNTGVHSTCIWLFEPTAGGFSAPQKVWTSGNGGFDWLQSKLQVTDHMGDGSTEITVLYDLGNATTGLYVLEAILKGFSAPTRPWMSAPVSWDWRQSKTVGYWFKRSFGYSGILYIDINLSTQVVSAIGVKIMEIAQGYFLYARVVYFSSTASTGGPGRATPTGKFHVYSKQYTADMRGPGYFAPAVPYVLWFYADYSIHGTYWHNDFGWPHTHGCVNLPTPNARWFYYNVPVGMSVSVHY